MLRKLAIAVVAVVSLGVAANPTGAMARGGGHGGGGHGGGHSGGPGFSGRGAPGVRGVPGATPFVGRQVSNDHRFAWIGHRRVLGRHIYGFIPGIGYGYYWYYDDCYVLTDYGWINICGYY